MEIASIVPDVDDGVRYAVDTARARTIREADLYTGVRISMDAHVSTATVKLQLDINFGDPITPAPVEIDYPDLRRHAVDTHPGLPAGHRSCRGSLCRTVRAPAAAKSPCSGGVRGWSARSRLLSVEVVKLPLSDRHEGRQGFDSHLVARRCRGQRLASVVRPAGCR